MYLTQEILHPVRKSYLSDKLPPAILLECLPAKRGGTHFVYHNENNEAVHEEKLSSRFHPMQEGDRILEPHLARLEKMFAQPPSVRQQQSIIFIGFFPVYHILAYLKPLLGSTKNLPQIAILESRELPKNLRRKALAAAGLNEGFWEDFLLSRWIEDSKELSPFLHHLISPHTPEETSKKSLTPLQQTLSNLVVIESPYARTSDRKDFHRLFHHWKDIVIKTQSTETYFRPLWKIHPLTNLSSPQKKIALLHRHPRRAAHPQPPQPNHTHWHSGHPGKSLDHAVALDDSQTSRAATDSQTAMTAIAVLGGISAETHLEKLRLHAREYPIYSLPGLHPWLHMHGIPVSALISCDAGHYNRAHFYWERHKNLPTPPLIAPLTLHPSIPRHYGERAEIIYMLDHKDFSKTLAQSGLFLENPPLCLESEPSVTLSMMRILTHIGYRRILTYGADFTLTPFKAHAASYPLEESCFLQHRRLVSSETQAHIFFAAATQQDNTQAQSQTHTENPHVNLRKYSDPKLRLYEEAYHALRKELAETQGVSIENATERAPQTNLITSTGTGERLISSQKAATSQNSQLLQKTKPLQKTQSFQESQAIILKKARANLRAATSYYPREDLREIFSNLSVQKKPFLTPDKFPLEETCMRTFWHEHRLARLAQHPRRLA